MERGDVLVLSQLASALESAFTKLESSYKSKNNSGLEKAKAEILQIQRRIDSLVR